MMETIYVRRDSTPFFLARQLMLKRKITPAQLGEYVNKSYNELISCMYDFGFKVKMQGEAKEKFDPTDSQLID